MAQAQARDALSAALAEYLAHLAVERGLAANTLAAYRRDLSRYTAYLRENGVTMPTSITPENITSFMHALRAPGDGGVALSVSSTARMLASVRGWHRFLALEQLDYAPTRAAGGHGGCAEAGRNEANAGEGAQYLGDPAAQIKPPTLAQRLPHALSVDAVQKLLAAASSGDVLDSLRNRALLELLYASGMRVSEAVGLDVEITNWDRDAELVMIAVVGKGNKERLVPVGEYARNAIEEYVVRARPELLAKSAGTHALFVNRRGGRLTRQSAWGIMQAAAKRADLTEHVSPHTLRHSFATHLLNGGADVRVVQELLGHASVATTQIYTLVTRDTLREVYQTSHPRAL